jgi:nucleoside-diphosphate-sugar epimerase
MSSISEYLKGKTLFVTGATGFAAKALVEKVLWEEPEIGRIYLMIRPRSRPSGRKIAAQERLEGEILQSTVFCRLKRILGNRFDEVVREKLIAVDGILTADQLGLDPKVFVRLKGEVDFVINFAGTVVFDEPLDTALKVNTLGPGQVVKFAKACDHAAFVHVSTAYVNGQMTGKIAESLLPQDKTVANLLGKDQSETFDLDTEISSIEEFGRGLEEASRRTAMQERFAQHLERKNKGKRVTDYRTEHQLEALRLRWIKKQQVEEGMIRARKLGWHDSYTLTKAMGEKLIASLRGDLPTVIIRPSIIESSLEDPEPGWIQDLKVADPLIVHYSKGRLPDFPINPNIVLDVVPVDIVANAIIAVLPKVRQIREIGVYHVASGAQNPIRAGELVQLVHEYFTAHPMVDKAGNAIAVQRWKFRNLKKFKRAFRLKYQIPAAISKWIVDHSSFLPWPSRLRRKVALLEATLEQISTLTEIYSAYTNLDCEFETGNLQALFNEMCPEDQKRFNFDVRRINWPVYILDIHIPGLLRHVLKKG